MLKLTYIVATTCILLTTTSCLVVEVQKKDNGKHKGHQNPKNPHSDGRHDNGHGKGKGKSKN